MNRTVTLSGTDIEAIYRIAAWPSDDKHHRGHEFIDQKIGFLLGSVTQHDQFIWVITQFPAEIIDPAMGGIRADNVGDR